MAHNEIPSEDHSEKWTEHDAYQLFEFMNSLRPTFQTTRSQDPIILAQEYQKTMDGAANAQFRKIMGTAGEETLNQIAPSQITYRHLAIVTNRLIVLSGPDGEVVGDYTTDTLVTGVFDRFAFEDADQELYAEKDWIAVKLIKPEFLFAQSRKIAIEMFDANKNLLPIDSSSELTIPVDAVKGRVYDPEILFQ